MSRLFSKTWSPLDKIPQVTIFLSLMVKEIYKNDFWIEGGAFLRHAPKARRDNEPWGSHPSLTQKSNPRIGLLLAEREGFEPPEV